MDLIFCLQKIETGAKIPKLRLHRLHGYKSHKLAIFVIILGKTMGFILIYMYKLIFSVVSTELHDSVKGLRGYQKSLYMYKSVFIVIFN